MFAEIEGESAHVAEPIPRSCSNSPCGGKRFVRRPAVAQNATLAVIIHQAAPSASDVAERDQARARSGCQLLSRRAASTSRRSRRPRPARRSRPRRSRPAARPSRSQSGQPFLRLRPRAEDEHQRPRPGPRSRASSRARRRRTRPARPGGGPTSPSTATVRSAPKSAIAPRMCRKSWRVGPHRARLPDHQREDRRATRMPAPPESASVTRSRSRARSSGVGDVVLRRELERERARPAFAVAALLARRRRRRRAGRARPTIQKLPNEKCDLVDEPEPEHEHASARRR